MPAMALPRARAIIYAQALLIYCQGATRAFSSGSEALAQQVTERVVDLVVGALDVNELAARVDVIFAAWELAYFGFSWATNGRTLGMALFGIRVARTDGAVLEPRHATVRALVFPFSFLFCGLGFLGILGQREHRALHDLAAGSAVVYAWTVRAPGSGREA
jgi:hypothetical protein